MKLFKLQLSALILLSITITSCKKKGCTDELATNYNSEAKKDDGTCVYDTAPTYTIPSTYNFEDESGNSTVSYSGQTDRLNQLEELASYAKSGNAAVLDVVILNAMFANTGDNGGGNWCAEEELMPHEGGRESCENGLHCHMNALIRPANANGPP